MRRRPYIRHILLCGIAKSEADDAVKLYSNFDAYTQFCGEFYDQLSYEPQRTRAAARTKQLRAYSQSINALLTYVNKR